MEANQVHYELFVRKTPGAPWTLLGVAELVLRARE